MPPAEAEAQHRLCRDPAVPCMPDTSGQHMRAGRHGLRAPPQPQSMQGAFFCTACSSSQPCPECAAEQQHRSCAHAPPCCLAAAQAPPPPNPPPRQHRRWRHCPAAAARQQLWGWWPLWRGRPRRRLLHMAGGEGMDSARQQIRVQGQWADVRRGSLLLALPNAVPSLDPTPPSHPPT
jgi:hypothetical protein